MRLAFNLAFDFEWASKNILFEQYKRIGSYFENSELKATGLPTGRELALLETVRDEVPTEVFTSIYANPVKHGPRSGAAPSGGSGAAAHGCGLEAARGRTAQSPWRAVHGGVPDRLAGIRADCPALHRSRSGRLGIKTSIRIVDSAQYRRRLHTFDFDIVVASFRQSLTPGNEQREYWGSAAADSEGSRNLVGIKNPAVDKLIEKLCSPRTAPT